MLQVKTKAIKALNQIQNTGSSFELYPRQLTKLTQNEQTSIQGVKNYNHLMEANASKFSQIGFVQYNHELITHTFNRHETIAPDMHKRTPVSISYKFKAAMHQNPYVMKTGNNWVVQLERKNTFKNNCMGWNFIDDGFSKMLLHFSNLDQAVEYCKNMGFSYQIDQPHFRYLQKKNYGDRMKWKGFPVENDPDC